MNITNKGKLKRCPSCGRFFSCMGEEDCWCENYRILKKDMLTIMNTYDNCICPSCLKKYEEK